MSDDTIDSAARPSRVARASAWIGVIAIGLAVLGIVGIQIRLLSPLTGFGLFALGAVLGGLIALLTGITALVLTRGGRDPADRGLALRGSVIGAVLVAIVAFSSNRSAPPINDITTNLDDPPAFASAGQLPENSGRDMSYPADFVEIVRVSYPDLVPIELGSPPDQAFARAAEAAESLGWEVTYTNREAGILEARSTSQLFRFVDDVVIRVRPSAGGSVIDIRSKSRDGRGDLGANAARIRAFSAEMGAGPDVATQ